MTILRDIRLDTDWICDAGDDALACRAGFWLEPLDVCARYLLHLNDAERPYRLRLGGLTTDVDAGSTELDVTEYVMLEDNLLVLTWAGAGGDARPPIGAVWLQAIACEDGAGEVVSD